MPIEFNFGAGQPEKRPRPSIGKKRRRPTPELKIPPPFQTVTGSHASLREEGEYPYCALMQVAKADTDANYVTCRGFDPRSRKFIDYAAGDPDKPGISVAKPYGNRTIGTYTVGEVYPAFLPTQGALGHGVSEDYVPPSPTTVDWRIGQNAGVASPTATGGHPQNLSASISELTDGNSKNVQWMLISGGGGTANKVMWGVATSNWEDNGASCDSVDVNPCDDCDGTNPDGGTTHTVYLPKTAEQDPNVIAGDVIGYDLATDATYCCNSDYLDEKIGTVKMWALASGNVQPGWAVMNGTDNSVVNGGSGIDLRDKFVRGATSSGGTGGTANHTHEIFLQIDPHTTAELAISLDHTHDAEADPHTAIELRHEHTIDIETPTTGYDIDVTPDERPPITCTNWPLEAFGAEGSCSGDEWGPLNHSIDVQPAYGGGTLPPQDLQHYFDLKFYEEEHLPEYVEMIFIERIDNSA